MKVFSNVVLLKATTTTTATATATATATTTTATKTTTTITGLQWKKTGYTTAHSCSCKQQQQQRLVMCIKRSINNDKLNDDEQDQKKHKQAQALNNDVPVS